MKRVFLIAPTHMNLYQDIVNELEKQGYEVEFLALKVFPNDPFFVFVENNKKYDKVLFLKKLENYWIDLYNSGTYSFNCDYLLVINGSAVHPILFSLLKGKNPNAKFINYLFDSTQNTYRFDRNFAYYDKIYTFDKDDAEKYKLVFLPIYWTPIELKQNIDVSIFGLGYFNEKRYQVFSLIRNYAEKLHLPYFIKLYYPKEHLLKVRFKTLLSTLFGRPVDITYKQYVSGMITNDSMSPELFRQFIINSDIIIDTSNPGQNGLTARFMWALGAGKRIITNNKNVVSYPFYNKSQFFVIGMDSDEDIESFLSSKKSIEKDSQDSYLLRWRIDKWIETILE